ncbi:hypothetical protein BH10ACI3_BH10ACI3_16490 [soil metagenome]
MKKAKVIAISMPEQMQHYVENRANLAGYSSVSEYIRDLVRIDYRRTVGEEAGKDMLRPRPEDEQWYYHRPNSQDRW